MVTITIASLWLPILLASVAVFLVSTLVHTVFPWHKSDYPGVPDEAKVRAALGPMAIPPGDYMVPRCTDMKEMGSPEFLAKMNEGPVVLMTVRRNGPITMTGTFVQWFIFLLVVNTIRAYVASRALTTGAPYLEVFRFVGVTGFVAYAAGVWPITIWYGRGVGLAVKATFDALLYATVAAGVFGWRWPH
ncbi:MAG: hypothetical protein IPP98_02390 [Gemmatimonadetes bacterium]|nr:hypothetical protein [Gemmatimonadota bacterium]